MFISVHLVSRMNVKFVLLISKFKARSRPPCALELHGRRQCAIQGLSLLYFRSHDCRSVEKFTDVVLQYLEDNGLVKKITKLIRFSDNCLSQYKSRYTFGLMSRKPYPCEYNYFAPMHGKYIKVPYIY